MFPIDLKHPVNNSIDTQAVVLPISDRIYCILIKSIGNNKEMLVHVKIALAQCFIIRKIEILLMYLQQLCIGFAVFLKQFIQLIIIAAAI